MPSSATPTISVIIRTYNRSGMVCDAIDSVLRQTRPVDEVVVVDDGSTDDTASVLARRFKPNAFRYLRLRENVGMAQAQRIGVDAAAGDYVAFLDSDDIWKPEHIAVACPRLASPGAPVLLFSGYGLIDEEGQTVRPRVEEPRLSRSPFEDLLMKRIVVT